MQSDNAKYRISLHTVYSLSSLADRSRASLRPSDLKTPYMP